MVAGEIGLLGGRDPHEVLGVREGASPQQVTKAFHRRALHGGHPDTGGDGEAFRRLVAARDVLLRAPVHSGGASAAAPRERRSEERVDEPASPRAQSATTSAYPRAAQARPASAGMSVLPFVLIFLYLVGIPIVLRAIMLLVVR